MRLFQSEQSLFAKRTMCTLIHMRNARIDRINWAVRANDNNSFYHRYEERIRIRFREAIERNRFATGQKERSEKIRAFAMSEKRIAKKLTLSCFCWHCTHSPLAHNDWTAHIHTRTFIHSRLHYTTLPITHISIYAAKNNKKSFLYGARELREFGTSDNGNRKFHQTICFRINRLLLG